MPPETAPLMEAAGVDAGYGTMQVLWGVDLDVRAGETVLLLGANGAGKTTFLKSLVGLIETRHGHIKLAGQDVTKMRSSDRMRLGIAPTIPHHCTREFMMACRDVAREHGLAMQTHVSEAKYQGVSAFKVFDHVQVITNGGPGEGTTASIAFTVLQVGFTANRQGYASAMAIVMLVIIAIASAITLKLLQRREVDL